MVGDSTGTHKGLVLFYDGMAILNVRNNIINRETLYCFENMCYCYEISNETSGYSLCMFYKAKVYLTLYTLKRGKQDGIQLYYDYMGNQMTKSLYKNNHLSKVI